jgi:hypothetical protein
MIVIANEKSGNRDGDLVLRAFRRVLNPVQVNCGDLWKKCAF